MKLFSKQRIGSIDGKRLGNYAVYALGEIVLVVIGILIAVSINNWNEHRKAKEAVAQIGQQVLKKMEADLAAIDENLSIISEDLKRYNLYLSKDTLGEADANHRVSQAPYLVTYSVALLPLNPVVSASLDKATVTNDALSDKLLEIEQVYKEADKHLKFTEASVVDELLANINHIKTNFAWYEKLIEQQPLTPEEYAYFETLDYRNRVVHMKTIYLESYGGQLQLLKESMTQKLQDLTAMLDTR